MKWSKKLCVGVFFFKKNSQKQFVEKLCVSVSLVLVQCQCFSELYRKLFCPVRLVSSKGKKKVLHSTSPLSLCREHNESQDISKIPIQVNYMIFIIHHIFFLFKVDKHFFHCSFVQKNHSLLTDIGYHRESTTKT